jgi:hypothetical protein
VVKGRSRIFLDSDRAGFRAVNITLVPNCNTEGASEGPITDESGTRKFERVFPRDNQYYGERYYVFEGGCAIYEFELTGPGRAGLAEEASLAMSFMSREDLAQEFFDETGLTL